MRWSIFGHVGHACVELALAGALVSVAACTPSVAALDPVAGEGRAISNLFGLLLALSLLLFLFIVSWLAYVLVRFRGSPGVPDPPQETGNRRLEIAWTITPLAILVAIFFIAAGTVRAIERPPASPLRLTVIGHQWWWEFRYPDLDVTAANELHVPSGVPLQIDLQSADVLHSFWVPQFGWMRDAIPNRTNVLKVTVERPGVYDGGCTQFCGLQHAWMNPRVVVESGNDFDAWVRRQRQPETAPVDAPGSLVARGRQLFLSSTCVSCHTVQGTAAAGRSAPDLTHLAGRTIIGGGVAANTPDVLRRWIRDPNAIKPGALMPGYQLGEEELSALVAYLGRLQ